MKIKIIIISDDQEQESYLKLLIDTRADLELGGHYLSLGKFFEQFTYLEQDDHRYVIILNIELKNINSINHIHKFKLLAPQYEIVIYSGFITNEYLLEAVKKGANGYVLKGGDPQDLFDAIHSAAQGLSYFDSRLSSNISAILTDPKLLPPKAPFPIELEIELNLREKQVAQGLLEGLSYQEIADHNNLSINTIRHYVRSLYKKLEVNSKMQLTKKLLGK